MSRILVVDDEVIISMQIEERLNSMGYDVVGRATSGREAVDKSRELNPDLVLMDIVMPGEMDGIEASRVIKDESEIPVVFLTAYADDENIMRAKTTEPFGYLIKPFQEREIKAAIEVALYNKHVGAKIRQSEQKYHTIMEAANDPILIIDFESQDILEVNRKAEELFGIDYDRFIGINVLQLFPDGKVRENIKTIKSISKDRAKDRAKDKTKDKTKDKDVVFENIFILNGNGDEVLVEVSACTTTLVDKAVIIAILRDVTKRELDDWERRLLGELKTTLKKAKRLSGIIPICAACKKIRDEKNKWIQLEVYIRDNSEADFSHGICPECRDEYFSKYKEQQEH